jgi:glycerol-3-phosphate acyltransferase PlsY
MALVLFGLLGYLVGSIPISYVVVRLFYGKDVRSDGSGNVGAFNAYHVSGSPRIGIIVGVLDAIKGFLVPFAAGIASGYDLRLQGFALCCLLLGHNYPVWLKFHGGRGLAPAAGGMFAIGYSMTIIWCVVWFITFKIFRNVLKANLMAIVAAPLIVFFLAPSAWIRFCMFHHGAVADYKILVCLISGIHLLRHSDVLNALIRQKTIA